MQPSYYVSNASSGSASGNSWTNKQVYTSFTWTKLAGGDTVYFDGGTDSLTYNPIKISYITPSVRVVITNGKDSGHNGKAILRMSGAPTSGYDLKLEGCKNIKLTGFNLQRRSRCNISRCQC